MPRPGVEELTEAQARAGLALLAREIAAVDRAYHQEDAPLLSDADCDALRRRNAAIEARFPALKRAESPSDGVAAAPSEAFAKARHAVPMLGLENAFDDAEVAEFDERVRSLVNLAAAAA